MLRRWLALAWIVTMAPGCDNVAWGGVDMRMQPPPSRAELDAARAVDETEAAPEEEAETPLPAGPLLLAGTRDGSSATLVVVGEVQPSGLAALPPELAEEAYRQRFTGELLAPGSEFVLFSEGVRVGRLVARETGMDERFCRARPTVTGTVELVPSASGARRLLALPAARPADRAYGDYRSLDHDYDQRVASLNLATEAIPQVGAAWPPSLLESRADIQAFRLQDGEQASIAATFLFQDRLAVAEPGENAYALFLVGRPGAGGWQRSYTWYRPVQDEGKGAPRYFSHLDWDGDGSSEILLDVLGADSRWFAGLSRDAGAGWTRSFQDPCGTGSSVPGG